MVMSEEEGRSGDEDDSSQRDEARDGFFDGKTLAEEKIPDQSSHCGREELDSDHVADA